VAMACPYINLNKSVDVDGLSPNSTIRSLIKRITKYLQIKNYSDVVDSVVATLEKNCLCRIWHLNRLDELEHLRRLNLPLLIERELIFCVKTLAKKQDPQDSVRLWDESSVASGGESEEVLIHVTPRQKELVLKCWKVLVQQNETAGGMTKLAQFTKNLYKTMFEREPMVKRLFGSCDIRELATSFGKMIGMLIRALHDPEKFKEIAIDLGVRHQVYGIQQEHFECMALAYSTALQQTLGKSICTTEVKHSWEALFKWASQVMLDAMKKSTGGFSGDLRVLVSGRWKSYWGQLTNYRLVFYKSKKDVETKVEVLMKNVSDVLENIPIGVDTCGVPSEWCFGLQEETNDKTILLSVKSEVIKQEWLREIDVRVIANQRAAMMSYSEAGSSDLSGKKSKLLNRWLRRMGDF